MIQETTKFDTERKSSTFLLAIMTLPSPANNTYSDIEFILRRRPFKFIMSNIGARIDP